MYIELSDLFMLLLLCLFAWHWWNSMKVREVALRAAKAHCRQLDLQMLDESMALRGFWFRRDERGNFRAWRSYLFEFTSTGDERYRGKVVTLGFKVLNIELPPHRVES